MTSKNKNAVQSKEQKSESDSPHQIFARNMRAKRKQLGYSQEELGHIVNLHRNYIGGIEQENRNPSLSSMQKIADGLKSPLWALLNKSFEPESTKYAIVERLDGDINVYDITDSEAQTTIENLLIKK